MDLSKKTIDDNDLSTLHLLDPETGQPLYDGDAPVTIELMHEEAPAYRKAQRELLNRKLKAAQLRQAAIEDDPQGEGEKAAIEQRAIAITSWQGVGLAEGPLECSFTNACRLMNEAPWVFSQVAGHLSKRANFTKRSTSG